MQATYWLIIDCETEEVSVQTVDAANADAGLHLRFDNTVAPTGADLFVGDDYYTTLSLETSGSSATTYIEPELLTGSVLHFRLIDATENPTYGDLGENTYGALSAFTFGELEEGFSSYADFYHVEYDPEAPFVFEAYNTKVVGNTHQAV